MNTFKIWCGLDNSVAVPYPNYTSAMEALTEQRHGGGAFLELMMGHDAAVAILRSARVTSGRTLFLAASQFAYGEHTSNWERVGAHVKITRVELLKYLDSAYPKQIRADLKIRIAVYRECLFVGNLC